LSQRIDTKEPEKKIPSTMAKTTKHLANIEFWSEIQLIAQLAFCLTGDGLDNIE
jgi:hypothetical protein